MTQQQKEQRGARYNLASARSVGEHMQVGEKPEPSQRAVRAERDFVTPRTVLYTLAESRPGADLLCQVRLCCL
jgi:hypothetical protein